MEGPARCHAITVNSIRGAVGGRALALAVALVEHSSLPWDAFRLRLIDAVAEARIAPTTRAGPSRWNHS